jgi:hypothetical protein
METKWNETNEIDWYVENGRKKIKEKYNTWKRHASYIKLINNIWIIKKNQWTH